jgi:hypothetical protein
MYDELIYQNDPKLPRSVRLWGCRFRCLSAMAEFFTQKNLSHEQITQIYDLARQHPSGKVMDDNCLCKVDEHHICKLSFLALKDNTRIARQVGVMNGNVPTGWDGKEIAFDYQIFEYHTKVGKHFVLANKANQVIFDPWSINYDQPLDIIGGIQKQLLYKVF